MESGSTESPALLPAVVVGWVPPVPDHHHLGRKHGWSED